MRIRLGLAIVLAMLGLGVPAPASARYMTGAALLEWCRDDGSTFCPGYIAAMADYQSVLQSLEDSADLRNSAYGYGVQATWPSRAGPLGIPIDQLLYSRELTVTDRSTGPTFGSEHRSLWVTIARSSSR